MCHTRRAGIVSGDVSDRKRLISITGASLRNRYIRLSGHLDFFPQAAYGKSSKAKGTGSLLTLHVEGLSKPVETDLATHANNGAPRHFFRNRRWVRQFFEKHEIREGDVVAVERLGEYEYRVYPFETKNVREGSAIPEQWSGIDPGKPTAMDLFAGCGGFSLGLERAGLQNLLAVEWDASCCDTFRANITQRTIPCVIQEVDSFPPCYLLVGGPRCQGSSRSGRYAPPLSPPPSPEGTP